MAVESHKTSALRDVHETLEGTQERASFIDTADGQIYTVQHAAAGPARAAVLICGPLGAERERAWPSLVRFARVLASNGYEALRFDYGGSGESTGRFEDQSLTQWCSDAKLCAARLAESTPGVPLVLHGVRLGALIAAELFAAGLGDGLLLWAPPVSAREHLRETLRTALISQRFLDPRAPSWTRDEVIAALETGEHVDVEGYSWSERLWDDARLHALLLPRACETRQWLALLDEQPCGSLEIPAPHCEEVDLERFWCTSTKRMVPPIESCVRASLRWLDASFPDSARTLQ